MASCGCAALGLCAMQMRAMTSIIAKRCGGALRSLFAVAVGIARKCLVVLPGLPVYRESPIGSGAKSSCVMPKRIPAPQRRQSRPAPGRDRTALGRMLGVGLLLPAMLAAADAPARRFDLPAGDAGQTLKQFAAQAGAQILYSAKDVGGIATKALQGEFPPLVAIERMLAGTPLKAREDPATRAIAVTRAAAPPRAPPPAAVPAPPPETTKTVQPNHKKSPPVKNRNLLSFLAGWLAAGHALEAQTTPQPNRDDKKDEVVQLSPFEVVSNNRGYFAPNTMSGTRFNSKIEDLASSMTVITKEQMQDFAMLDVNDIFLYAAGAEGTGTYTDLQIDSNGSIADNVALNPTTANRIRGIGSANISMGNFETMGRVPIDPLAVDAVEVSRGPNSTVFGLGNPSGTVNQVTASAQLTRDRTQSQFRADSYGGYRTSLDLNRVLLKNKLAVRVSGAFQHDGFVRKPSGVNSERYNGMVKYSPFRSTTISAGVQFFHQYGRRPNFTPPRDNISYWAQSGRPTWDPVAQVIHVNGTTIGPITASTFPTTFNGINIDYLNSTATSIPTCGTMFVDRDGLKAWLVSATFAGAVNSASQTVRFLQSSAGAGAASGKPGNQPLFTTTPSVSDKSMYDWSSVNLASVNFDSDRVVTSSFQIDQHFFRTGRQSLDAQVALMREDAKRFRRDHVGAQYAQGQSGQLFIDVNEKLLDGTPNPFFLRPYIGGSNPQTDLIPAKWDSYRGQLVYRLDFSAEKNGLKWLGWHQLSGYGEYKYRINRRLSLRESVVNDLGWNRVLANNTVNNLPSIARVFIRYYVGDAQGNNADYGPGNFSFGPYPWVWGSYPASPNPPVPGTGVFKSESAVLGLAPISTGSGGANNSKTIMKARGWMAQNHFLNERVVTTFGIRQDELFQKSGYLGGSDKASQIINPDGFTFNYDVANRWAPGDYKFYSGQTKQGGAVVRPFRNTGLLDRLKQSGSGGQLFANLLNGLSFTYNESSSFRPQDPKVNIYLQPLPNPSGRGKDYGFWLDLADGRVVLRVNRWQTQQLNKTSGIASRVLRVDIPNNSGQAWILNVQATNWVTALNPAWTQDQVAAEVARQTGISTNTLNALVDQFNNVTSTQDVTARGTEIELNFNPTRHWTLAGSVTETEAINTNVNRDVEQYINERMKIWTTIVDQRTGQLWWNTNYGGTQTAAQNFATFVQSPFNVIRQLEGKANPQLRRYAARASTNYRLAGITEHPFWRNINIGGAVRWEDRGAIGYYGVQKLPATITDLDTKNPIYDKSNLGHGFRGNYYFDAFVGYRRKLWGDKVGATFQLNVRNLQENGRLQPIAAFPDGTPSAYRIVDPRQFIFSVSLDL
jgi:outer membrane receptor protein involved in Fe transport